MATASGGDSRHIRASEPGEVIEVDRDKLLALVQTDAELSEILMRAFILRRVELVTQGIGDVVLIGSAHSAGTLRAKEFLTRNGHPHTYIDLDRDPEVQELLDRFQVGVADIPIHSRGGWMMAASGRVVWVGRAISVLVSLVFLLSAFIKLKGGPELTQGMAHLGLPESMVTPLAVLELSCVVIYLVPATSVLGAILLAGYVGGTICTAWRVGDPSFLQIGLGIIVWLGLYLREPRLRALIPIRTAPAPKETRRGGPD